MSRQAVDQALARSSDPPQPREISSAYRFYDLDEISDWWRRRLETQIRERRMKAVAVGGPTGQVNIRVNSEDIAFMKSITPPGQSMAHTARILILEAIAARKAIAGR